MKFKIETCSLENSVGEILDIHAVYNGEKYISLTIGESDTFSLVNELEVDVLCLTLKKLLKAVNGDSTTEVDMRIPGVGC